MKKIFKKLNSTRLVIDLIILACIILLGVSGWLWWTKIFMNPAKILDSSISKNLQTRSIVKRVSQTGSTGGIDQVSYLSFFPPAISTQTNTVLSQGIGPNSASVSTETIGTPDADYVRYTEVKGADNLSGIDNLKKLLGIWAGRHRDVLKGQDVSFLNESLFGIVPFGDFDESQKQQLLDVINQHNLYAYSSAERSIDNGRPVYTYSISIDPKNLVEVMREYVRVSGGDPTALDPTQYEGLNKVDIKLTVDILSRQLTEIKYPTGRVETYSGQNLYRPIVTPDNSIPIEDLQRRLQGQGQNV